MVVVGGGASGAGVALDASLRGLKVAVVERSDFAAGTSSRSTKLIHGGLRYLAQTFQKKLPPRSILGVLQNLRFEPSYLRIVSADLKERAFVLESAPYMTEPISMLVPLYTWWELPMMFIVGQLYDLIAGDRRAVPRSTLLTKEDAMREFPALAAQDPEGRPLFGALRISDGQQDDARMCLHIALTAAKAGACCVPYMEVEDVAKQADGSLSGVVARDRFSDRRVHIRARQVVNACGVFADGLRKMADPACASLMVPSYGAHVALREYPSPNRMGLVWFTEDGRVLYLLPWKGSTIAGTTDTQGDVSFDPMPGQKDVDFILSECNRVLADRISDDSVRSAWAGIRPLVRDPTAPLGAEGTAALSRDHVVEVMDCGLVTVVGGKWTTYRKMAEDAVDACLRRNAELANRAAPCSTLTNKLIGTADGASHGGEPYDEVVRRLCADFGLGSVSARHLTRNYGLRALDVADVGREEPALLEPIHPVFPHIRAEVIHACRYWAGEQLPPRVAYVSSLPPPPPGYCRREFAETLVDVIAHRTRFSFLNVTATVEALPLVTELMAQEKGWTDSRVEEERAKVRYPCGASKEPKPDTQPYRRLKPSSKPCAPPPRRSAAAAWQAFLMPLSSRRPARVENGISFLSAVVAFPGKVVPTAHHGRCPARACKRLFRIPGMTATGSC